MNRRKALFNIISFGFATGVGLSVYNIYKVKKTPPISDLINYKELIMELAETIIPVTNTPGTKMANVQDFIINVITNCSTTNEQNNFIDGLVELTDYCGKEYGKSFSNCTTKEKNEIMAHLEQKGEYKLAILNKISNKIFGQSFFLKLKSLTVDGYCSSKLGATEGLAYDYIPGSYQSYLKLHPGQKSWATK